MKDKEIILGFLDERLGFIKKMIENERKFNHHDQNSIIRKNLQLLNFSYAKVSYLCFLLNTGSECKKTKAKELISEVLSNCFAALNEQETGNPSKESLKGIQKIREYLNTVKKAVEKI